MAFEKGKSGNPNGRPRGAKDKINKDLREMITRFLNKEFNNVKKDFRNLSPKDRVKFYTELLSYGVPKLQSTTLGINFDDFTDEQLEQIVNSLTQKANESR